MAVNTKLNYYQRNKERLLANARNYYINIKEKLLANTHNYYNNNKDKLKQKSDNLPQEKKDKILNYQKAWRDSRSEEEIIKMREYSKNWYRNLPGDIKNKKR